jgi:hypothetical protein
MKLDGVFRKSTRSGGSGNCVEVAALPLDGVFRKSSRSGGSGDCVEVAAVPGTVQVRDSKDPAGPVLAFSPAAWRAFVATR